MRDIIKIRELLNSGYTWQECFDYFKYVRWNKVRQNNVTAQAQILSAFADKDKRIAELEKKKDYKVKDGCVWIVEQYTLNGWIPRIVNVHSTRAIARNKTKELNENYCLRGIYFRTRKYLRA